MGKLLGFKKDALKYVNLDNDTDMFDTYELYIRYFKKFFSNEDLNFLKLINRDLFKQLIMTSHYGIGKNAAFKDFNKIVSVLNTDKELKKRLLSNFTKIFNILKSQRVEGLIYNNSKYDFIKAVSLLKSFKVLDLEVFINYFKCETYVIEYKFNGVRKSITMQYANYNKIDIQKTDIALFVNAIHMLDASFLRRIVIEMSQLNVCIVVVHDGFGVPFFDVGNLILYANEVFLIEENLSVFDNINKDLTVNSNSIII
jgi:DNA-directed RNA polymerase